jgi:hypothetical protein
MAFTYNEQDVKRESQKVELTAGWYKFVTAGASLKTNDAGDGIVNMRCAPLDPEDGETPKQPNVWNRLVLPIRNEDVDGHLPPQRALRDARQILSAMFETEVFLPPARQDGKWFYRGEEIDGSEVEEKTEESTETVMRKCAEIAEDPALLKDCLFYAKVVHNNGFVNLYNASTELPAGEELVPLANFTTRVSINTSEGKAKTEEPKSKAAAKPAAKTAAPAKKAGKK